MESDPPVPPGREGTWQAELIARLGAALPPGSVEPYGSVGDGAPSDGWSDLDVRLRVPAEREAQELLGAPLWAWQESRDEAGQHLRLVLGDGRRVDALVTPVPLLLPPAPLDNENRFVGALAATRLGRGNLLIGLHLVLGILRDALVEGMLLADRDTGTSHHRLATEHDSRAEAAARVASRRPLRPDLALQACELYGRWRQEREPAYRPDWTGLREVIGRGREGAYFPSGVRAGGRGIEVRPYSPEWPRQFASVERDLRQALRTVPLVAIEHVGSTSVPGLAAKPILDIDVIVRREDKGGALAALTAAGYVHEGDFGVTDREALAAPDEEPPRHVYVCVEGTLHLRNHLAVRAALRARPELRDAYGAVKLRLASDPDLDIVGYGRGKSSVLQDVLDHSDLTPDERRTILHLNTDPDGTAPAAPER